MTGMLEEMGASCIIGISCAKDTDGPEKWWQVCHSNSVNKNGSEIDSTVCKLNILEDYYRHRYVSNLIVYSSTLP